MKPIPLQLVTVCLDNGQQGVFVGVPLVADQNGAHDGQIEDIWFGSGYQWDSSKKEFVVSY